MKARKKGKKIVLKIIGIIMGVLVAGIIIVFLYFKTHPEALYESLHNHLQSKRDTLVKSEDELLGTRFIIPRDGKDGIKVNIYIPENVSYEKMPVIFNVHGGAFVGGDADLLDTMSDRLKDQWNAVIVTINYTKADIQPKEYAQEEIRDTVLYFATHADKYYVDPSKFVLLGYSAGAYHVTNAAILLQNADFHLAGQILFYPYVGDTITKLDSPDDFRSLSPVNIIVSGKDALKGQGKEYAEKLKLIGVDVELKEFEDAYHGFMEENNPEFENNSTYKNDEAISPAQKQIATSAENYINEVLDAYFSR